MTNTMLDSLGTPNDRIARLHRYLLTAATGSTALAGVANAAIVTSTSVGWSGWTATVDNPVGTVGARENIRNSSFGDARLDSVFVARVIQGGNVGSVRLGKIDGSSSGIHTARLADGAVVGAALGWTTSSAELAESNLRNAYEFRPNAGSWRMATTPGADSVRGYLAFRMSDGGSDYYYGYFDVTMSRDGSGTGTGNPASAFSMTIHGWAYNDVAGQSITIGAPVAVPGGAGLTALAVGAVGLRGRRRSKVA